MSSSGRSFSDVECARFVVVGAPSLGEGCFLFGLGFRCTCDGSGGKSLLLSIFDIFYQVLSRASI